VHNNELLISFNWKNGIIPEMIYWKHNFKFQNTAVLRPRDQWFKHCKYWACQSVENGF
jgi:hypothetical protein